MSFDNKLYFIRQSQESQNNLRIAITTLLLYNFYFIFTMYLLSWHIVNNQRLYDNLMIISNYNLQGYINVVILVGD